MHHGPQPEEEDIWGEYAKTLLEWYDNPLQSITAEQRNRWSESIIADARVIRQDALRKAIPGPFLPRFQLGSVQLGTRPGNAKPSEQPSRLLGERLCNSPRPLRHQ